MRISPSFLGASILLVVAAPLGCKPDAPPPAASAEPRASASAPPIASARPTASAAAPAVTHQPGTVPTAPTARAVAAPDAGALAAATFTRTPAAKSRKPAAASYGTGFLDKRVTIVNDAAFEAIDPETGAGFAIAPGSIETFATSPDGAHLVLAERAGRVNIWDIAAGKLEHTWPLAAVALAYSADGKRLAIGGAGFISVRDLGDGKEISRITPDAPPFGLAFGAGGKEIVTAENATQVAVYAVDGGAKRPGGGGAETTGTFALIVSPDGRHAAASAPAGHGLQVFDVHAWGPRTLVVVPEGACQEHMFPTFSENGRFLFGFGGQRWVKGFEVGTWKPYASYHAPPGRTLAGTASDLSRVLLTGGPKGVAVVTVGNTAEVALERPLGEDASYSLAPDGLHVVGAMGNTVRVWASKTGRVTYEIAP